MSENKAGEIQMRLLLYATGKPFTLPQIGGNKRFVELAAHLCNRHGADLCCADEDEHLGDLLEKTVYRFRQTTFPAFKLLPPEARRLIANRETVGNIKRKRYDGVIVFDVPPAIGLCLSGVQNVILMIRKDLLGYEKTIHPEESLKNLVKRSYLWFCEDICIRKVKGIIVQCKYDKMMLLDRHPRLWRLESKIRVQINNVNPTWIEEKAQVSPIFQADASCSSFRICFIGNFNDRRKGHEVFLPAVREITEAYDYVSVDIIGAGRDLDHFRSLYESGKIHFHGHVANPLAILKSCDLLVVPSFADSCPNTVMEALYCRIPVIGSDRGGIPEILHNNPLELFEMDSESIKQRIVRLLDDKSAFRALKRDEEVIRSDLSFDWASRVESMIYEMLEEDSCIPAI